MTDSVMTSVGGSGGLRSSEERAYGIADRLSLTHSTLDIRFLPEIPYFFGPY